MRLFVNFLRRREQEDSLDAELRAHVEELTDRNIRKGLSREEARRQALVETGGIEGIKEEVREEWLGQGIETALQDIRHACRSLRRSPGFAAIAVATLALGIGTNVTMFSLMRAVLWRPLPYPEPDRIVTIQGDARNTPNTGATTGEVRDLRERARTLEQVSVIEPAGVNLDYAGVMEHAAAAEVSGDFLPLLGARPLMGRTLDPRIDVAVQPDGSRRPLAVLIGYDLWRRRFALDPAILGKAMRIDNAEVRIAGVMPPGFRLFLPPSMNALEQVDVWLPWSINPALPYRGISVLARLRRGVSIAGANAELETLVAQFEHDYPAAYAGTKGRFTARALQEDMTRDARPALFLLSGAVGFVLLIACVNVANLLLARGSARQREWEIRRALGAGRGRIVRQLLSESLALGIVSAAAGLFCARLGLEAIGRFSASHIPLQSRIEIDAPVAWFALALSVAASMLFGLLPAWRLASAESVQALRAGRAETAGSGARTLQRTLVVAEVALSIVPLACGGAMLRSFVNLMHSPLGFDPSNIVTAKAPVDLNRYPDTARQWALLSNVLTRIRALPGVEAASSASPLPLAPNQERRRVGRADQLDAVPILATQQGAIPGYLATIGTPLREGRDFTVDEISHGRNVTIVDERLAKRLWPEGALGKQLAVFRTGWRQDLEVVGVIAPVRVTRVRDEGIPHFMMPSVEMSLAIRTSRPAARMAPAIQEVVAAAHAGRAAFDIRQMTDYVADSTGDTRFILFVLAAFAGASVLLAAVGLYGTLAYLTARRTREFGIRLALGSSVHAIVAIVVRESVLLAAAGSVLGLLGAATGARAIRELLYGVRPLDGWTLAGVVALVALAALSAAGVPAWRAARIDPQESLRSE